MGMWVPAVAMIGLALVIGSTVVLTGPVGKALAEWIRGWSKTDEHWMAMKAAKHGVVLGGGAETLLAELAEHKEALEQELEAVRREVAELAERVDFAERLLAKHRESERLAPPRGS